MPFGKGGVFDAATGVADAALFAHLVFYSVSLEKGVCVAELVGSGSLCAFSGFLVGLLAFVMVVYQLWLWLWERMGSWGYSKVAALSTPPRRSLVRVHERVGRVLSGRVLRLAFCHVWCAVGRRVGADCRRANIRGLAPKRPDGHFDTPEVETGGEPPCNAYFCGGIFGTKR